MHNRFIIPVLSLNPPEADADFGGFGSWLTAYFKCGGIDCPTPGTKVKNSDVRTALVAAVNEQLSVTCKFIPPADLEKYLQKNLKGSDYKALQTDQNFVIQTKAAVIQANADKIVPLLQCTPGATTPATGTTPAVGAGDIAGIPLPWIIGGGLGVAALFMLSARR